ncbi:hypothetical protein BHE74_00058319 [Ensete ventricosum]|nr:hypothetical protein BHE74_00058319 [Ensete ventricosum]
MYVGPLVKHHGTRQLTVVPMCRLETTDVAFRLETVTSGPGLPRAPLSLHLYMCSFSLLSLFLETPRLLSPSPLLPKLRPPLPGIATSTW